MRLYAWLLLLLTAPLPAAIECEASSEVLAILAENSLPARPGESFQARTLRQEQQLLPALAAHPGSYALLRRMDFLQTKKHAGSADAARWIESEYTKQPDSPAYVAVYASRLWGVDTPRAIALLEKHPENPWTRMMLARIHSFGRFKDAAKAKAHAEAIARLCPATLDSNALAMVSEHASPETLAGVLGGVRARLEKEPFAPHHRNAWEWLWGASFKGKSPAEFAPVREQVKKEAERLEPALSQTAEGLNALAGAWRRAGDAARELAFKERLLKEFPRSDQARYARMERRNKDLKPFEPGVTPEARRAAFTAKLAEADKDLAEFGDSFDSLNSRYWALSELEGADKKETVRAGLRMIDRMREEGGRMWPPAEIRVAEIAVRNGVMLDLVSGLLTEADKLFPQLYREADYEVEDRKKRSSEGKAESPLETAAIWLDYYRLTGQMKDAQKKMAVWRAIPTVTPWGKFRQDAAEARIAEWEGRKLDALILYRRAASRVKQDIRPERKFVQTRAEALLKELGEGSDRLLAELEKGGGKKIETAEEGRWEKKSAKLPQFTASDLKGGKWTITSFEGKTVIANVWASWCGPCRAEHPELEKLYQQTKDRKDLLVVSLNVDDDVAEVEPYMKEGKYTFPVLLARELVDTLVPSLSIPRMWVISRSGGLEWEQVGFGPGEKDWPGMILDKARDLLR